MDGRKTPGRLVMAACLATALRGGAALGQAIFADDPAADGLIADWIQTLPPDSSAGLRPAATLPPADPLVELVTTQLSAYAADADLPPEPGLQPPSSNTAGAQAAGCTLAVVNEAAEPIRAFTRAELERAIATYDGEANLDSWQLSRMDGPPFEGYSLDLPYPLADAAALDRLSATGYWTARWQQYHGGLRANQILRSAVWVLHRERDRGLRRIPDFFAPPSPDRHLPTAVEVRDALRGYLDLRSRVLGEIAVWLQRLEARDCTGVAAFVHFRAARILSVDEEYRQLRALGRRYWEAFAEGYFFDANLRQTIGSGLGDRAGEVEAAVPTLPSVASYLGPLPAMPTDAPVALTPTSDGAPEAGAAAAQPALPGDPPLSTGEASNPTAANWDAPVAANPLPVPGASHPPIATEGNRTFVSARGLGSLAQPDLAGFWRSSGLDESNLTLIAVDQAGEQFEGFVVLDAALMGTWIDMAREGETTGWRGQVHIALREPAGACPRWTQGVFIVEPGSAILNGAWAGQEIDPATCAETDEPEGAPLLLERVIATTFQPIVPGKYIHLVGAPGAGPTPTQYAAAVEFACAMEGLAVAGHRVSTTGGRIVERAACRYQLIVDSPGSYDIAVEFLDAQDSVLHTDRLRAEIPAIPGLLQ